MSENIEEIRENLNNFNQKDIEDELNRCKLNKNTEITKFEQNKKIPKIDSNSISITELKIPNDVMEYPPKTNQSNQYKIAQAYIAFNETDIIGKELMNHSFKIDFQNNANSHETGQLTPEIWNADKNDFLYQNLKEKLDNLKFKRQLQNEIDEFPYT